MRKDGQDNLAREFGIIGWNTLYPVPRINTYLAQRAQQRARSLVDRNKEDIAAAERIIMAASSSSKDLQTLKRDAILAFLLSRYESSHKERLDGMTKQALVKELKEWVCLVPDLNCTAF